MNFQWCLYQVWCFVAHKTCSLSISGDAEIGRWAVSTHSKKVPGSKPLGARDSPVCTFSLQVLSRYPDSLPQSTDMQLWGRWIEGDGNLTLGVKVSIKGLSTGSSKSSRVLRAGPGRERAPWDLAQTSWLAVDYYFLFPQGSFFLTLGLNSVIVLLQLVKF